MVLQLHVLGSAWLYALVAWAIIDFKIQGASQLNATLQGRLMQAKPWAQPCFSDQNGTNCKAIIAKISSAYFRVEEYQGFQNMQGEGCMSDPNDQCILNATSLLVPASSPGCQQGITSPYYVEITTAADVQAVFQHARTTGTILSIKNTGHDYVMRSSRQGSIAVWTRKLQEKVFHESFAPDGCSELDSTHGSDSAVTFGAGVSMDDAISFAHQHGVLFAAGSAGSLGASGGWLLNGGHSHIANTYGLAVDRILQLTIVTPDGQVRTANRCTNKDLFWALRGGGGGAFGVVLNSTWIAEPETPLTSAFISFPGTAKNRRPFVELLAENMLGWALSGWSGPSATNYTLLNNPFLNTSEANTSLSKLVHYARGQGGSAVIQTHRSYFDYYALYINGSFANPAPVSTATFVTSRIVPENIFRDTTARTKMVDAIFETEAAGLTPLFLTTTPFLYGRNHKEAVNATSLNPAWYRSIWHVVVQGLSWTGEASKGERIKAVSRLGKTTKKWIEVIPDGCTYANEADPWLEDWTKHFWGDNYPRLVDIKRRVDPDNLLSCWHCVGWEDTLPQYGCIHGLME
ncbi:FAD-binding domain-containing protein [Xylaria arbuscula]|nr:FAD-binding domain-containing protein [Xylaria arbuscula]